ncbi:MAG: hypothetical protein AAF658_14375 [Myxococcota bacterium]
MKTPEIVLETLKDWVAAAGGLVTKDDLHRLESRLEEIDELLDELEEKIAARSEAGS